METSVAVALVGAAASVIAAVVSLYAALNAARLKAKSELALERAKIEASSRQRAFEMAVKDSEPLEAALNAAWGDIQIVRDVIQKAVTPALYDEAAALELLRGAVSGVSNGYKEFGASLPADADAAWHSAKNAVQTAEALLRRRGTGVSPRTESPQDVDRQLEQIRASLREAQHIIQQSMLMVRGAAMKRLMNVM
jgi:hypothetical protein